MPRRFAGEGGIALVIAIMSMMLMAALGSALIVTTMTEAGISSSYAGGIEAFYAADAALEETVSRLPATADWTTLFGTVSRPPDASPIHVVVTVTPGEVPRSVVVTSQASGPRDTVRTVELTVAQTDEAGAASVRRLTWREVR